MSANPPPLTGRIGSPADLNSRLARISTAIAAVDVDQLLVSNRENLRYVSGFSGSHIRPNGACLIGTSSRILAADSDLFRFVDQPEVETQGFDVVLGHDPIGLVLSRAEGAIGFEDDLISVAELERWQKLAPGCTFVPCGGLIEDLRAVKDSGELQALRAASELSDAVLEWFVKQDIVGRTERELALAIDRKMSELGAQGRAFDTRVLTGARAAQPHGNSTEENIVSGQQMLVDFGCALDGYCSDCTRMFAIGSVRKEVQDAFDLVLQAQIASLAAAKAGVAASAVDAVARKMIADAGFGDAFGHGLGHGIGLVVHEKPTLTPRSTDILAKHNVVSIEPGIYKPGSFGIRVEDLVIITSDGVELLTHFPKGLLQL